MQAICILLGVLTICRMCRQGRHLANCMGYPMEYAQSELSASVNVRRRDYEPVAFDASQAKPGKFSSHTGVLIGFMILVAVAMAFVALATWSASDPSLSHVGGKIVTNWMGYWGASFADIFIQFFGLGAAISLFPPAIIGWLKILRQPIGQTRSRLLCWPIMTIFASATIACITVPQSWPLPSGLGGVVGDMALKIPALFTGNMPGGWMAALMFFSFGIPAFLLALYSSGMINRKTSRNNALNEGKFEDLLDEDEPSLAWGAFAHWYLSIKSRLRRSRRRKNPPVEETKKSIGFIKRIANYFTKLMKPADDGLENFYNFQDPDQQIDRNQSPKVPDYGEQIYDAVGHDLAAEYQTAHNNDEVDADVDISATRSSLLVQPMAAKPKQSTRIERESQTSLFEPDKFELPSLFLLAEPKNRIVNSSINNEALEQNARLLEGVLSDFGVKGEIVNVRPGPVVTLYELEPAPGIKSSRVIGLADDVARSMSAISARIAVVPGRNAIGIELPNQTRETVYLREVLASEVYEKSKAKLPIILGKNIGGGPVLADLAKMPHLLVAGTTGSGKSVAINTMILSILYRLNPDQVKMIMIDPKMLELSIYDGIPHLLTPVVTDPKKAVVALKWTVREMEERYKSMSKLGVRNIEGYNLRLAQAVQKNEVLSKTVQTGFDRETGEAIYQTEELDLEPMPFIVVIIDEMADLMMVAGKDIEGTVQRLAQMARAAGIHVIMATQRPSVDVITGTIKANFPTRISFQVTSKIDSRTILGEQGAEQLLGMGDMLYQAGGGRISRVHGPFVDDGEVENIVAHLKTQGTPQYLESVTAEDNEEFGDEGGADEGGLSESGDIYDHAVSIVLRDRKVSTSYIQRRLSIGYNRAATLIERMEQEGLISAANHSGKREIMVPAEDETI